MEWISKVSITLEETFWLVDQEQQQQKKKKKECHELQKELS